MDSNIYFEKKFEELSIKKIDEAEVTTDSKIFMYKGRQVELIYFNPERITYKSRFFNYLKYMKEVQNEFTVKNIIGYTLSSNRHHIILEELGDEKPLIEYIKNFNFLNKLRTILNLIKIIIHFHSKLGITLKVLSTHNIFVLDEKLKLNVSNLRRVIQECSIDNFKKESLYYEYLPPDLFDIGNNDNVDGEIEYKCEGNIWSLGCILSELFSGIVPWYNKYSKNEIIIIKLLVKKTPFPIPDKIKEISNEIHQIIGECVNTDLKSRPPIECIYKIISKLIQNKENIYSLLFCSNNDGRLKGLGKKYLISIIYKYL
jgi:serine/threonine protein kinase